MLLHTDIISQILHTAGRRILMIVAVVLGVAGLASCSDGGDEPEQMDTHTVSVTLTLAVNQPTSAAHSRAFTRQTTDKNQSPENNKETTYTPGTWNDDYTSEDGRNFENYIDVNKLHVVFYSSDGEYLAEVQNLVVRNTNKENVYEVEGNMLISVARTVGKENNGQVTFDGKVVVYANIDAPASATPWNFTNNLEDITKKATFSYASHTTSNTDRVRQGGMEAIPMWGIEDFRTNTISLNAGQHQDLGTIYLLRSMAKVSVHFTNEMREAGFQFTKIELNNYNTSGSVAPEYNNIKSIVSTKELTYAQSFHLPNDVTVQAGPLSFLQKENDTVSLNLYIPEYQNVVDDGTRVGAETGTPATISIGIKRVLNGTTTNYSVTEPLRFRDYDTNGKVTERGFDIVRNHHYRFYIYNDHLDLRLVVEPWTVVTHTVKDI